MKQIQHVLAFAALLFSTAVFAQSPQKMSYQMVVRNSSNALVTNQTVGVRISLLQGSATGTAVFVETHTPTTNANGLASFAIGDGTVVTGSFAAINWGNGPYFIKTEADPAGGTSYTITSTTQLMSVPYALFAGTAAASLSKTHLVISGDLTNAEAAAKIAAEGGPNTQFLWIQNTTNLTTLNITNLTNLVEVVVQYNDKLASLTLSSLTTVNSKMFIADNSLLETVSFNSLNVIAGPLEIKNNNKLTNITLPSLQKVGFDLNISSNNSITGLSFPALVSSRMFSIANNPNLTALSIPVLDSVYNFEVPNNKLTTVSAPALSKLKGTGTSLSIINDNYLTSLSFPALKFSAGYISIQYCPNISSLSIASLMQTAGLTISYTGITSFSVPALTTVNGPLTISNTSITNLSVPVLTTVKGAVMLNATLLTSISFPQLGSIDGDLSATNNTLSSSIEFPQLTTCANLTISNNTTSSFLTPQLSSAKAISIVNNAGLYMLSFSQLSTSGNISFTGNHGIGVLTFPVLTSINFMNASNPTNQYSQSPSAPPTGQGIIDRTTLLSRPNTVNTN